MDEEARAHNESLLQIYTGHLRQLELMAAKYGDLAVPPYVTLEIAEYRRKIAELEGPRREPAPRSSAGPRHNLPSRDYEQFIGRQPELAELRRLLGPRSRSFVITIDGIGGIGKSALVLESAYTFVDQYHDLPEHERFEAIIWVSAKRTYLTASGIRERRQVFRTIEDVFAAIARVLDYPAITRARPDQQRALAEQVLREQRTLLLLDNLETVDDEELLDFLHELPEPTKALITTRHRIDVARPVRLADMNRDDALLLIAQEAARKHVTITPQQQQELWQRTGGLPLAVVWSIGLISVGHGIDAVLRRLSVGQNDLASFCFAETVARIRGRNAERLLLALAVFERSVSRAMLGEVAGLGDDVVGRDDGLAELLQVSLINQRADRFKLLPLTHNFAREMLRQQPELDRDLRERWIGQLRALAQPYATVHHIQPSPLPLLKDGRHLVGLAQWARQAERNDVYLAILPAVLYYTDTVGDWTELLSFAKDGLEQAALLGRAQETPRIYCTIAWVQSQQGHHDQAEQALHTGLAIARQSGSQIWEIESLARLAQTVRRRGDLAGAAAYCDQAYALTHTLAGPLLMYERADIEYERGKIARDRGDWAAAQQRFQAAHAVFNTEDISPTFNVERAWGVVGNLAYALSQQNDTIEAVRLFQQSLAFFRQFGGRGYTATLLVRLAELEARSGMRSDALAHVHEALDLSRKLGMVHELAQAEALLATLAESE
jgi:LuxR family glucitol operon transcriptional activator